MTNHVHLTPRRAAAGPTIAIATSPFLLALSGGYGGEGGDGRERGEEVGCRGRRCKADKPSSILILRNSEKLSVRCEPLSLPRPKKTETRFKRRLGSRPVCFFLSTTHGSGSVLWAAPPVIGCISPLACWIEPVAMTGQV